MVLAEQDTRQFPTKIPIYFPGERKETRVYSFRDLPKLIRAVRAIFKNCAEKSGQPILMRFVKSKQFMEDSFAMALWARFGKELAENLSISILAPILEEALRKMLQERDIQLKSGL